MDKDKGIKKWFSDFKKQGSLQLMVIPGILYFLLFSFVPMVGLIIAFQDYDILSSFTSADWVGLANFKLIAKDKFFWESVVNTLGISFLKLIIGFPVTIIFAVMIFMVTRKYFQRTVQTISYLPHFLSWVVLGGMMLNWFSTRGLFNQLLMKLGLVTEGKNFLLEADNYWWIAALSDVWKESGWGTILYLSAMTGIDTNLFEAAEIDGASKFQQTFYIIIPSIKNMIGLNFILSISGMLNSNLDQTLVLMNSQNQPKAEVISSYVYRLGLVQGDFSYSTAAGLGISIVSLILLLTANKITKKLTDTSIF